MGRLTGREEGGCLHVVLIFSFVKFLCFSYRSRKGDEETLGLFDAIPDSGERLVTKLGPAATLKSLHFEQMGEQDLKTWAAEAAASAVISACSRSWKSVRSGIASYLAFAGEVLVSVCVCVTHVSRSFVRTDRTKAEAPPATVSPDVVGVVLTFPLRCNILELRGARENCVYSESQRRGGVSTNS